MNIFNQKSASLRADRDKMITKKRAECVKNNDFHAIMTTAALFMTFLILSITLLQPVSISVRQDEIFDTSSIFRLHILANSDSERDQQIKLKVRDALLAFEAERTSAAQAGSAAEAEHILAENGAGLLKTARSVLQRYGADYDAQLMIGTFEFPERQYGSVIYPEGQYRALRILLGDALGKNWWCVMFPPLCIVEADEAEIEYEKPLRFESLFVRLIRSIFGG